MKHHLVRPRGGRKEMYSQNYKKNILPDFKINSSINRNDCFSEGIVFLVHCIKKL